MRIMFDPFTALFVVICAPIWLVPNAVGAWQPVALAAAFIALSYAFLRSEQRALAVLRLDPSWRRLGELVAGLGAALIVRREGRPACGTSP